MTEIANTLQSAGYTTFLPHRDGLEFARLLPELEALGLRTDRADTILQRAIFSLDVYELLAVSDAVVANLNGRVPDEGTVVEASLAWHSGKALVLYKADSRTILSGSDHPMLTGLASFHVVDQIAELPKAVGEQLQKSRQDRVREVLNLGQQIAVARKDLNDRCAIAQMLLTLFGP
jgi:hypothetical protein